MKNVNELLMNVDNGFSISIRICIICIYYVYIAHFPLIHFDKITKINDASFSFASIMLIKKLGIP